MVIHIQSQCLDQIKSLVLVQINFFSLKLQMLYRLMVLIIQIEVYPKLVQVISSSLRFFV
uniref:Uncharacterized protein n=1 Tax=uncultured marine virus TaxID=186617 RepID=A0A0F7L5Q1_9VIRU|nr:hypothetical protein ALOHA_HF400048F7ctg1g11 [uncultured marine virus]